MTLSYTFAAKTTPPLACDCLGAVVYVKLAVAYRSLTRDGHGVLRAKISARVQNSDATWTYSLSIDESGLVNPLPDLGGGMVEAVCCQGCVGYAAEAYNMHEFGGRLVEAADEVAVGTLFVRHTIRPFLLSDWRAWIDTAAEADVEMTLMVDGEPVSTSPLVIPAGDLISDSSFVFTTGRSLRISEHAKIEILVGSDGDDGYGSGAALGLETWFFGHLNPSNYFAPEVAIGSSPVNSVGSYDALLLSPIGTEFYDFPYIYKMTSFGVVRIGPDTTFDPPA